MSTAPSFPDRRHDVRRVVNREFSSVEEFKTEYVHDVSRGGVFIRSDSPLPPGTRVTLRCTVLQEELETIEGVGEVMRVVPPGGPAIAGMGVAFVELTSESRELIEKILVRR